MLNCIMNTTGLQNPQTALSTHATRFLLDRRTCFVFTLFYLFGEKNQATKSHFILVSF